MMSNFENMDVILRSNNVNPIERKFSKVIGIRENHDDIESNSERMIPLKTALDVMSMKT